MEIACTGFVLLRSVGGARFCFATDTVSERLRKWTRNLLGPARRDSNPLGVAFGNLLGRLRRNGFLGCKFENVNARNITAMGHIRCKRYPLEVAGLILRARNFLSASCACWLNWAHGVVVSHPLSMREALGSIPSVSTFFSERARGLALEIGP